MSTMSEVLASFKKDIKNSFQAQKNIIDVTEKYIGLLENAEGGGSGAGGIDYSETEQDTGLKWIDGNEIYQLTISKTATNRSAEVDLTSYGIKDIIEASARIKAGDYTEFPGYYGASNDFSYIYYQDSNKKIRVDYGSGLSTGASVYLTIRYTKASGS